MNLTSGNEYRIKDPFPSLYPPPFVCSARAGLVRSGPAQVCHTVGQSVSQPLDFVLVGQLGVLGSCCCVLTSLLHCTNGWRIKNLQKKKKHKIKQGYKTHCKMTLREQKKNSGPCFPPKLTFHSLDFQGNALVFLRTLAVLFLACFLRLCKVLVLETFHPVQRFAVLQCRAVVLEPADNVGASEARLDLQLAVLLRRWPLSPTEHLSRQIM